MTETQTAEIQQTAIAEYTPTVAALADLRQRFGGLLFPVTTPKGLAEAKVARAELRDLRTSLEAKREEIKKPVLERGRMIDAEAKRITAELELLEKPIDAQIKAEERRRADVKAAANEAERQRIDRLRGKLVQLQGLAIRAIGKSADEIAEAIAFAEGLQITAEAYEEFADLARIELATALKSLKDAHALQAKAEQEAADLKERMRLFEERQATARHAQEEEDQRRRDAEQHQREETARVAKEQKAEQDRLAALAADVIEQSEKLRKLNEAEADRLAAIAKEQDAERERLAKEAAAAFDRAWDEAIAEDRMRFAIVARLTPEQEKELRETGMIAGAIQVGNVAMEGSAIVATSAAPESPAANATADPATSGPPASIAQPAGNFDGVEGVTFVGFSAEDKIGLMAGAYSASKAPDGFSGDIAYFRRSALAVAWLDGYKTGRNEAVDVDTAGGA